MFGVLWIVIALLVMILLLFFLADWYLKRSDKKKTSKPVISQKTPAETAKEKQTPTVTNPDKQVKPTTMTIYNSNLADDLDAILKDEETSSLHHNLSNRLTSKGQIANYVAEKHYHTFTFDNQPETIDNSETPTFTKEDYKKIVALSNIDDKK